MCRPGRMKRWTRPCLGALAALLALAGCGGVELDRSTQNQEYDELKASGAVKATARFTSSNVKQGDEVALTATFSSTRSTIVDIAINIKKPDGSSAYSLKKKGQSLLATVPLKIEDGLTVGATNPAGTYPLSVTVIHTGTGKVLLDKAALAQFVLEVGGGTDTVAPTVSFSSPADKATVSGKLSVTGTASDNVGVSQVQIQVDKGSLQTASGTTSWTASIDTTALANGSHTLTARALDAAGNAGTATRTITVSNGGGDVTPPPAAAAAGYTTIALNDDFDGTSLDASIWSVGEPMGNFQYNGVTYYRTWNPELAYMTASQVRVQNSNLILTAAPSNGIPGPQGTRNYVSGNVSTYGKFGKQFYYAEIRAKLPAVTGNSTGLWPGLWLYDAQFAGNEIDLMESFGGDQTTAQAHVWAPQNRDSGNPVLATDYSGLSGFNTYAVLKTPTSIQFYLNNELRYTCPSGYIESDSPPQALILELKLGDANWMPRANPSQWGGGVQGPRTADFVIDWVRVWTL